MNEVDAPPRRTTLHRRALTVLAVAGAITTATATAMAVRNYMNAPAAVLVVESAVGTYPTGTLAPDAAQMDRQPPLAITIDDIELWGSVDPVGIMDNGELEVPDETAIGWYRYGSAPGLPGATVLAAHVSWNRTIGPFHKLGELEPGAEVDVFLHDGSQRTYQVTERQIYAKDALPRERIWNTTGDETLVLITCGGSYNPDIRRYRENIVVYAVPVENSPGTSELDVARAWDGSGTEAAQAGTSAAG